MKTNRYGLSDHAVMISWTVIDVGHSALSKDALAALQEFYNDRDVQQKRFEELKLATESHLQPKLLSMDMFTEDWNASQFWVRSPSCLQKFCMLPIYTLNLSV